MKVKIQRLIEHAGPGSFHFAEDFIEISNDVQVRLGPSRLVKKELVTRLARGIYYYPKQDSYWGKVSPAMEKSSRNNCGAG